ncbi:MAG: type III secretion system cytoplasmic ring protein SctQ [Gammaproteobacteria bacterium]
MTTSTKFPRLNKSVLGITNLISTYSSPVDINIDGQNYKLRLQFKTTQTVNQPEYATIIKARNSTFIITINEWPEFISKNNHDVIPLLRSRSRIVRKLTSKVLLSPILHWVENIVGEKPILFDAVEKEIQLAKPHVFSDPLVFYYQLTSETGHIATGTIKVNNDSSAELEQLLEKHSPSTINNFQRLGLNTQLYIGSSTVTASEMYNLEMGDVVLFDQDIFGDENKIIATISDHVRVQLELKKSDDESLQKEDILMVDKIPNHFNKDTVMSDDNHEEDQYKENKPDRRYQEGLDQELNFIDEINVKLEFELGSISLPISQVKKLSPGYVLSLDKPLDKSVHIFSNGQLLGVGEIVNIEGTTGVRLKSFLGK